MAVSHLEAPLDHLELLAAIVACPDAAERDALVQDFLVMTEPLTKSVGAQVCRAFKADMNTWLDEFIQITRMAALAIVREAIDRPDFVEEIQSYKAILTFRARSGGKKFIDSSGGFNQASGMAGYKRRRDELERTRAAFFAEGVDPTDQEIVDRTNERMLRSRSDAARQGMICSIEDLHVADSTESIEDHAHPMSADVVESDSDLHRIERVRLIALCIIECQRESEQLGDIAKIWFAPALEADYDAHPTAAFIATQVGIEASTARAKVARVKQVAQRVAREQFDIRRYTAASADRPAARPAQSRGDSVAPAARLHAPLASSR